jgi:hypothetical protein
VCYRYKVSDEKRHQSCLSDEVYYNNLDCDDDAFYKFFYDDDYYDELTYLEEFNYVEYGKHEKALIKEYNINAIQIDLNSFKSLSMERQRKMDIIFKGEVGVKRPTFSDLPKQKIK